VDAGARNAGAPEISLMAKDSRKERLDWIGTEDLMTFSDERCSLELMEELEAWFLEYLKSDSHRGKR
jgi:hypothetical protein